LFSTCSDRGRRSWNYPFRGATLPPCPANLGARECLIHESLDDRAEEPLEFFDRNSSCLGYVPKLPPSNVGLDLEALLRQDVKEHCLGDLTPTFFGKCHCCSLLSGTTGTDVFSPCLIHTINLFKSQYIKQNNCI
jgi:hypothetical protein